MVKAVHMTREGKIEVVEHSLPTLEQGAVLIKTSFSEVCGTDIHLLKGHLVGVPYPIIPGHVSTGIIEDLNGMISDIDSNPLKKGDAVTFLDVHETCNNCWFCLVAKETTRCPQRKVYGITYGASEGLLGGWSQYIYLKPGVKIIKLPDSSFMRSFMAAGCGLPTAIHATQRSRIKLGDTVVIQGAGPVGLMAALCAKINGAFQVIMVGAPAHRLALAKEFDVGFTINIDENDSNSRVQKVLDYTHQRGADVTIEATGVPSAVKEGLQMTRDGGNYTIVGQYTDTGEVSINPHLDINKKHITIRGSWGSDLSHFYLAVKLVQKYAQQYPFEKIISRDYSLDEIEQALDDVEQLRIMKAIIRPNNS
ncbi:MAG: zinc-binding dehydrogenase [Candidatus Hodarchaeales archaeon]|jgi:L-iditol 2-dehydrogenase